MNLLSTFDFDSSINLRYPIFLWFKIAIASQKLWENCGHQFPLFHEQQNEYEVKQTFKEIAKCKKERKKRKEEKVLLRLALRQGNTLDKVRGPLDGISNQLMGGGPS